MFLNEIGSLRDPKPTPPPPQKKKTKKKPQQQQQQQKFVSAISLIVNERVPDDCCKPAIKFLVRNYGVKGREIEGLDACDKVEIWRLEMFS